MSQRTLSLDDRVLGFLLESPNIDYEIETWVTLVPLPKDPPRAPIPREVLEKTTRMARECYGGGEAKQRPIFHLLGRKGSGRRALAEIACREAGVPLLVADMAAGGSARDKAESMWRLGRESLLQNAAILVENFDQLLEEESKPAMTAFLETIDDFDPDGVPFRNAGMAAVRAVSGAPLCEHFCTGPFSSRTNRSLE